MKLSLSWIKDFVNIPEDMDMKQLAYDLTMDTVEVEDVEYLADRFDHMVVGVIEDIEPHPNADKLRVCKVDIGDGEIKDIVCGGINLEKGMRVAVSCPGAIVRWHGEGEPVHLTRLDWEISSRHLRKQRFLTCPHLTYRQEQLWQMPLT